MDSDDGVPLLFGHVKHHAVPEDTGGGDDDVQPSEGVQRKLNQLIASLKLRYIAVVGDGFSAIFADLVDHLLCRGVVETFTIERCADVVNDDSGAKARELQDDPSSDATAATGNDGDLSV